MCLPSLNKGFTLPYLTKSRSQYYFLMALFIMQYKVVLTFKSVDEIKSLTIQLKAPEQYFPVGLFIMLYKVVPTFESVDEILKCYHLNESY